MFRKKILQSLDVFENSIFEVKLIFHVSKRYNSAIIQVLYLWIVLLRHIFLLVYAQILNFITTKRYLFEKKLLKVDIEKFPVQ